MQIGQAQFHSGHWQESVNCLEKALQLDPIDPIAFSTRSCLAQAYVALGQDATHRDSIACNSTKSKFRMGMAH
jgi:predicted Zn-dependent protease